MIYNLIGSSILVAVGAGVTWAVMEFRHRKMVARMRYWLRHSDGFVKHWCDEWKASEATISRPSDTVGQLQDKSDKALDCVTPSSAHVGKKMAAILTGERL